ncbi:uncharacterized protein BJ171DRAFT_201126 [Polychytrium aggregatum]|uniref:uncharacterized protein n=1 Tax=Polychytrium aggregatum TaxID=110093 RepID=UPI0022FF1294|nr:uncharacterized protein BJ171DRAFT_201126 [Polychytrium aggregatum]KAI9199694.1 hypothetical protein BJ171DRAFT_201126 [Polychytrium aggregatum]
MGNQETNQRRDDMIKKLQDELNVWKQKYEAIAKLYAQLRKEHLDLLNKFKEMKEAGGKFVEEARNQAKRDIESASTELKAKKAEMTDLLIERDRLKGEADRLRTQYEEDLFRTRRELEDTKASLAEMGQSKGAEVQGLITRFSAEKEELEQLNRTRQAQIEDLRRRLDDLAAETQKLKLVRLRVQAYSLRRYGPGDAVPITWVSEPHLDRLCSRGCTTHAVTELLIQSKDQESSLLQGGLDQTLIALSTLQKTSQEKELVLQGQLDRIKGDHNVVVTRMLDHVLQTCVLKVEDAIYELESPTHQGNQTASPEYVLSLLEKVQTICNDFGLSVVRLNTGGEPWDVINTSNAFAHVVGQVMHNSKGVVRLAAEDELAEQILAIVKAGAMEVRGFFLQTQSHALASMAPDQRSSNVLQISKETQNVLAKAGPAIEKLIVKDVSNVRAATDDLGDIVEREMTNAARAIEEAAKKLQELMSKPRAVSGIDLNVHDAILAGAMAITTAIANLIKCATATQKEIAAHGRGSSTTGAFYKKNHKWTEGLISAAKSVAVATTYLVECADGVVSGTHTMEQLVVAAGEVSVATTQLVAASRVQSVPFSKTQDQLENAAVAVREATKLLVKAAKDAAKKSSEDRVDDELAKMGRHEFKVKEMEQQVLILEIEKKLQEARYRLAQIRKQGYQEL